MIEGVNEDKIEYKEKDIVWAKVKGYPWWPSIISNISLMNTQKNGENTKEKIYSIEFIGEKNNTKLTRDKIEPFNKNYEQHSNTKNTSLLKSIEQAKKIYDKKHIMFCKENIQDKNSKKEKEKDININNQNMATKKSHDASDEKTRGEKDNENNIKFLQKKRINEHVILDDDDNNNDYINEDEEKNNDINYSLDNKNKEDKKVIPIPKKNIKINININLTTNNQNMVNINSFHPANVLTPNNPNNIISNSNFNPINYSSLTSNEDNNINLNNNNNKNNTLIKDIRLDEESIISSIEKNKNKSKEENTKNEKEKEEKEKEKEEVDNINNNNSMEENEEDNESDEENENDELRRTNNEIKELTKKLLNCQIQNSNLSIQKTIITSLTQLSDKLNELLSKNPDIEIYNLTKDLIPILVPYTFNKNNDILIKATELLSFLNERIMNEIFFLSQKEQQNLIESLSAKNEKDQNQEKEQDPDKETNKGENLNEKKDTEEDKDYIEGLKIVEMINQKNINKSSVSENLHISFSKRGRPKKSNINSEISSEFLSSKNEGGIFNFKENINLNENNVCEEFIKTISCTDKNKMEIDFKEQSNNFFNNIYDKNNKYLDAYTARIRKQKCRKIFKLICREYPEINKEFLKKVIIYYEYKIRNDFSNIDKNYSNKINSLCEMIKEKICNKTKLNK